MKEQTTDGAAARRIAAPPWPHEHGAWVMLLAPVLTAWAAAGQWPGVAGLVLLFAIIAAFLGRHAASLALRGRGRSNARLWALILGAITIAAGAWLVFAQGYRELVPIGILVAHLFAAHSVLASRRRQDRSEWGEILGVAALTLTGPAAHIVAGGRLDIVALALWAGATLFFAGGVFSVKSRLAAVRVRGPFGNAERRRATRDSVAFHVLLAVAALGGAAAAGGAWAWLVVIAFLPALVRAFHAAITLTNRLPNLKIVGAVETGLALWFSGFFAYAMRLAT